MMTHVPKSSQVHLSNSSFNVEEETLDIFLIDVILARQLRAPRESNKPSGHDMVHKVQASTKKQLDDYEDAMFQKLQLSSCPKLPLIIVQGSGELPGMANATVSSLST